MTQVLKSLNSVAHWLFSLGLGETQLTASSSLFDQELRDGTCLGGHCPSMPAPGLGQSQECPGVWAEHAGDAEPSAHGGLSQAGPGGMHKPFDPIKCQQVDKLCSQRLWTAALHICSVLSAQLAADAGHSGQLPSARNELTRRLITPYLPFS